MMVQNAVASDLEQNGLELESVSLTALDQTSSEFFNPNNAFDAEGLTRLTEITEAKKQERNEVEQTTRVAIEQRNLDAEKRSIDIRREEEYAKLDAERDVANRSATTKAETAELEAEADRKEKEAQIQSNLAVQQRRIDSEKSVQISEQEKSIAVANKSQEDSHAQAEASTARANAVQAEEQVKTVARVAEADRQKQVVIVDARQDAERQAVAMTVAAEAEKMAAEDKAYAVKTEAAAEAEAVRIKAQADEVRYRVEADGQTGINASRNVLDPRIIEMDIRLATIQEMPGIIEASLKPVEKIKDIRILDMGGSNNMMPGNGHNGSNGSIALPNSGASTPDTIVDALMRYRMQAPVVDQMLSELGLESGGSLTDLVKGLATNNNETTKTSKRNGDALPSMGTASKNLTDKSSDTSDETPTS